VRAAAADLLLGARCAACTRPGPALCSACRRALVARPRPRWPDPPPAELLQQRVQPYAAGDYAGVLRRLVVAYKDGGRAGLVDPLGRLLASVVEHGMAAGHAGPVGAVELVPVPSSRASRRRRGRDPVADLARLAAGRLRRRGVPARVVPRLTHRRRVEDQAGLDAVARAANLRDAMVARAAEPGVGPEVGPVAAMSVVRVVVDDVLTTGATVAEAVRVLRGAGFPVHLVATVGATPRRTAPGSRTATLHFRSGGRPTSVRTPTG